MGKIYWAHILVLFCLAVFLLPSLCQGDSDDETTAIYIVTLRQTPSSHFYGELRKVGNRSKNGASKKRTRFQKPRYPDFLQFRLEDLHLSDLDFVSYDFSLLFLSPFFMKTKLIINLLSFALFLSLSSKPKCLGCIS